MDAKTKYRRINVIGDGVHLIANYISNKFESFILGEFEFESIYDGVNQLLAISYWADDSIHDLFKKEFTNLGLGVSDDRQTK